MATSGSPRRGHIQTQNPAARTQTRTQTQTQTQTQAPVLRLRGATATLGGAEIENAGRRVQWAEGVVNNEGMGRKSSKVCCIYHAPKGIDESSDESSSDSSSDESDSGDDGAARPAGGRRHAGHGHGHNHDHGKGKARARSPNAYEKMPKPKGGGSALKGK